MASTSTPVDLNMTAGLPYLRSVRITDGRLIWATLDAFEVRSHIRSGKVESSPLLVNLTEYFTKAIDGDDIVLTLALTGEQTRLMQKGYYDVIVSDPGPEDARAIPVISGKVKIDSLVTAAADD